MPLLVETVGMHPDQREPLCVMTLERPTDFVRADRRWIGLLPLWAR